MRIYINKHSTVCSALHYSKGVVKLGSDYFLHLAEKTRIRKKVNYYTRWILNHRYWAIGDATVAYVITPYTWLRVFSKITRELITVSTNKILTMFFIVIQQNSNSQWKVFWKLNLVGALKNQTHIFKFHRTDKVITIYTSSNPPLFTITFLYSVRCYWELTLNCADTSLTSRYFYTDNTDSCTDTWPIQSVHLILIYTTR